jgi:hypothetical protein
MGEGEGRERAGEGKESPPKIYDMASSMMKGVASGHQVIVRYFMASMGLTIVR